MNEHLAETTGSRDQAATLRIMVSSPKGRKGGRWTAALSGSDSARSVPWTVPHRVLVVVGGAPGVGATTVARNLAAGAAARGIRAKYIGPGGGTSLRAGLPLGRVVPLRAGLPLGRGVADYYLLDPGASRDAEGLADYLVVVASPDPEAVKGAYLALKRVRASEPELPAGLIVNRARSPEEGAALAERVASAARAFIRGSTTEVLGWILDDEEVSGTRPGGARS